MNSWIERYTAEQRAMADAAAEAARDQQLQFLAALREATTTDARPVAEA